MIARPQALLPVPIESEFTRDERAKKRLRSPEEVNVIHDRHSNVNHKRCKDSTNTVNLVQQLAFPTMDAEVAFMSRPTCKIGVVYVNL